MSTRAFDLQISAALNRHSIWSSHLNVKCLIHYCKQFVGLVHYLFSWRKHLAPCQWMIDAGSDKCYWYKVSHCWCTNVACVDLNWIERCHTGLKNELQSITKKDVNLILIWVFRAMEFLCVETFFAL